MNQLSSALQPLSEEQVLLCGTRNNILQMLQICCGVSRLQYKSAKNRWYAEHDVHLLLD
jgi:hypothetical protein